MTQNEDIRWEQRFFNFKKALAQFNKFINKGQLSELEEQGLIKAFEYTYELGWNTLKDYLKYQGTIDLIGSRDTIRAAFKVGLINNGEGWMDMLKSRNKTSHTYNEETAAEIADTIVNEYHALFEQLAEKMEGLLNEPDVSSESYFGLKEQVIQQIIAIFVTFPEIEEAILYGSRAKGNYMSGSDIDLTLKGKEINLKIVNSVGNKLDDLLLPYTIDLSIYHQIDNTSLIEHINRVGKVIYKKSHNSS